MKIVARDHRNGLPLQITVSDQQITDISPFNCDKDELQSLPFVCSGFFDIQVNGLLGTWFCSESLTTDDVASVTDALISRGITRYFPTLITASREALKHGFSVLQEACRKFPHVHDAVAGYHLEGPYISAEDGPRGAHPINHVRAADWDEFQELQAAAEGRIRLLTLAPEAPQAIPFIQSCVSSGVVVAIGHTGATPQQIRDAAAAGARLSTHFGNGAHGVLPRHPNYLWEQLATEQLAASIIADGWHLPPSVISVVLKCKGLKKTILTCDASGFAGCSPGVYQEGDVAVEVLEDGRVVVAGQRQFLAGSGATTGDCVGYLTNTCGISLPDAVRMATTNPATLFSEELPELSIGQPATMSIFRLNAQSDDSRGFEPLYTLLNGRSFSP